jgi:uncharacterized membrane protein YgcG
MNKAGLVGLGLCVLFAFVGAAHATERITDFDIQLVVQPDGDLIVTETISVVAEGDKIKRGIFRDFPTAYRTAAGFLEYVDFDVLEVARDGQAEPYFINAEYGYHRLYVGEASRYISRGAHVYRIKYRTSEQIGFFAESDELYWNLTGNFWDFEIGNVSAELILPPGAVPQDVSAYTGASGERGRDYQITASRGNRVTLRTTRSLQSGEGLTVSVSWQKGLVTPPTFGGELVDFVGDNTGFFVGCLCLLLVTTYFYYMWRRFGQDPEKGVIIPLFEPPADLSAVALGYIHARGFDGGMSGSRALTVAFTSLAIKGFVTIEDLDKRSGVRYVIRRTGKVAVDLPPGEKVLLEKLFDDSEREELSLGSAYDPMFDKAKDAFLAKIRREYTEAYFRKNGGKWFAGAAIAGLMAIASAVWSQPTGDPMILAGALAFFASVSLTFFFTAVRFVWRESRQRTPGRGTWPFVKSVLVLLGVSVPTVILGFGVYFAASLPVFLLIAALIGVSFVFFDLMEAPTVYGRQIMDRIDGYLLFLTTTEWDRMQAQGVMATPNAAMFEKHLPYSMALGVDDAWSKTFAKYAKAASIPPEEYRTTWYRSGGGHVSDFSGFSKSFSAGLIHTMSSASTPPPSSSNGSGGGGSSGGGGGGGGGGGW